jgi:hypothetical protein
MGMGGCCWWAGAAVQFLPRRSGSGSSSDMGSGSGSGMGMGMGMGIKKYCICFWLVCLILYSYL